MSTRSAPYVVYAGARRHAGAGYVGVRVPGAKSDGDHAGSWRSDDDDEPDLELDPVRG